MLRLAARLARSSSMERRVSKLPYVPLEIRRAMKVRHINTCDELLAVAADLDNRLALARAANISAEALTEVVCRADLARVYGTGFRLQPDADGGGNPRCGNAGRTGSDHAAQATAALQFSRQNVPTEPDGGRGIGLGSAGAQVAAADHVSSVCTGSGSYCTQSWGARKSNQFSLKPNFWSLKARNRTNSETWACRLQHARFAHRIAAPMSEPKFSSSRLGHVGRRLDRAVLGYVGSGSSSASPAAPGAG